MYITSMSTHKLRLLQSTLVHLKLSQLFYRVLYLIKGKLGITQNLPRNKHVAAYHHLRFSAFIVNTCSYTAEKSFTFLNLEHEFEKGIDWNYSNNGKLWTYNLTYFDYLLQEDMYKDNGTKLINDFIDSIEIIRDGLEAYPTNLRGINWIKFISLHNIDNEKIDLSLYAQYRHLLRNLEYHLLGNHLLENGFSLLFGAYYFQDERFYSRAKRILHTQLSDQILADGGHFERSPMYHKIILHRLLDSINLVSNNRWKEVELLPFLRQKAEAMVGFLLAMTYREGITPHLNDSTDGIAPETDQLVQYARRLGIESKEHPLGESGYRKIERESYECVIDVASIGPDYIPGHAHADTLSFELRLNEKPFIVDTGISTYEKNERRQYERSTAAHNTVEILSRDSSEVWGGFRVGRRAKIRDLKESDKIIEATHDGYKHLGIYHTRRWTFEENKILIEDSLNKSTQATARLHFHPTVTEERILAHTNLEETAFRIADYQYAEGYNRTVTAKVLELDFKKNLKIEVRI